MADRLPRRRMPPTSISTPTPSVLLAHRVSNAWVWKSPSPISLAGSKTFPCKKRLSKPSIGREGSCPMPTKPERCSWKRGARPSRSLCSASRRTDGVADSIHHLVRWLVGAIAAGPSAERRRERSRRPRSPSVDCIVPAKDSRKSNFGLGAHSRSPRPSPIGYVFTVLAASVAQTCSLLYSPPVEYLF